MLSRLQQGVTGHADTMVVTRHDPHSHGRVLDEAALLRAVMSMDVSHKRITSLCLTEKIHERLDLMTVFYSLA